jgi:DNA-binding XRE family transcriptional regulator
MDFGEQVKQVREKLSLSQMEMAKAIGVSYSTLNRWENKKFEPNYRAMKKFEEVIEKNNIKVNN